jgi:Mg-chelatase subunit ChlD
VKLDATKEAARVAVEMLDPTDQVAIVVFDSEATVHVPLQPAANKTRIGWEVAKLTAGGGTAFLPALQLATSILAGAKVKVKHTILMSDGEAPADGVIEQVKKMREAKITISTVGLQGADRNLLNAISDGGVGRLYMVNDLVELPKIFAKEISTAIP